MRPEKSLFNALLTHFLMGVALGLSLALLLGLIDAFHVRDLVGKSGAPVQTALMLVTTYGLMFGIGAPLLATRSLTWKESIRPSNKASDSPSATPIRKWVSSALKSDFPGRMAAVPSA